MTKIKWTPLTENTMPPEGSRILVYRPDRLGKIAEMIAPFKRQQDIVNFMESVSHWAEATQEPKDFKHFRK
jgi:hypothetical protein